MSTSIDRGPLMEYGERDFYMAAMDRLEKDADFYREKLFDAWKALREQQRGMKHQARKIKWLRKELAKAQGATVSKQ